ncbi:hypothetical protein [Gymnodinialimonas ulvae]|uniref:hypothetical protein n=1 Tax=Gymnodinialimonas ulvae TaxID=3126504 RepID=UPI0030AA1ADC
MEFSTLIQTLVDWVVSIGAGVNGLPGTVAFGLGLFTWFAVEQVLQRLMNGVKWAILIGVVVALGLSLPYLIGTVFGSGTP